MKKIILTIFSFLILSSYAFATLYTVTLQGIILANPIIPQNWYVTSAGAGAMNGTSQANAWAYNSIGWGSIHRYDTVYFCGTIHTSGLSIPMSGAGSTLPLYVRGDCPSNAVIIDGANLVVSSWSSGASNVYSTPSTAPLNPGNWGIVTEDDAILISIPWNTNIATTTPLMVSTAATFSTGTWTYDPVGQLLYILTTAADDPTGHTIEASSGSQFSELVSHSQSNVYIQNLTIKNAGDRGLELNGGSNNTVTGCTIYNVSNWGALIVNNTNATFTNNTLHHIVWATHLPDTNQAFGESVRFFTSTGTISGNNIYDTPNIGIDLYHTAGIVTVFHNTIHDSVGLNTFFNAGIYFDEAQNNNVYDNLIYNFNVGLSLNDEDNISPHSQNNLVYNNLIYNWYYTGIYLGGGVSYITSQNNFVYNNTIVIGPSANLGGNQALAVQASNHDTFKNNIMYGNVYTDSSHQILGVGYYDYNQYLNTTFTGSYTSFAAWQTANGGDSHSGNTSPSLGSVFVDASGLNFELVAASSPIGNGVNLYSIFTTDYDGGARQSSGAWDVGAYAYP